MLLRPLLTVALQLSSCLGLFELRRDNNTLDSSIVDISIADFVASLRVPDSAANEIISTLAASPEVAVLLSNTTGIAKRHLGDLLAPVACKIAKLSLGRSVVTPPTQSLIEVNWYVLRQYPSNQAPTPY